jgi:hypothetical protein
VRGGATLLRVALRALSQRTLNARRSGRSLGHFLAAAVLSGLVHGAALAAAVMLAVVLLHEWSLAGLIFCAAALAIGLTPGLIRHVTVPLGATRATYVLSRLRVGVDEAEALVAAARAHVRRPSDGGRRWLERALARRTPTMLGDVEVIVHALLAAPADPAGARALLATLPDLVERHAGAREVATEYLAASDAAAGAWAAIVARARAAATWPASPMAYLLEGVALRQLHDPAAPSMLALRARWLLAPYRRRTWALLRLAPPSAPSPAVDRAVTEEVPRPRGDAPPLAIHARALREPTVAHVRRASTAWDAWLADATAQQRLRARATELGVPDADVAARHLRDAVASDLAALARAAGLDADAATAGSVGAEARHRARAALLAEMELVLDAYRARAVSRLPLPGIDEWRAFVAIRDQYAAAARAGGMDVRRLLFPHLSAALAPMSSWLWNQRREYVISHAMTQLLLREATEVGDVRSIEHESRNAKLIVPTRSQ